MDSFRIERMDSGKKGNFSLPECLLYSRIHLCRMFLITQSPNSHNCTTVDAIMLNINVRGQEHSNCLSIFCSSVSLFVALLLLVLLLPVLLMRYLGLTVYQWQKHSSLYWLILNLLVQS